MMSVMEASSATAIHTQPGGRSELVPAVLASPAKPISKMTCTTNATACDTPMLAAASAAGTFAFTRKRRLSPAPPTAAGATSSVNEAAT